MSNQCHFCDFGSTYEYEANDHFQYGVGDDAVMLCARVTVIACTRCSEKWTDHRSEVAHQEVVEEHLATKDIFLCTICHEIPVDVTQGIDMCDRCEEQL